MHIKNAHTGNIMLVANVSKKSNTDIPPMLNCGSAPSESEQMGLSTASGAITTMHAHKRETLMR